MDALEAILTRRSIRKYTPEHVSSEQIEQLLGAAMSAPSAGNEQPWHFIVIRERTVLDEIPSVHPYSQMLHYANAAILVCADMELETHKGYFVQDCAAATQNILIAAKVIGLATVWLGVYPREDRVQGLRKILELPEHVIPFSLIPVGYPDESKPPSNRFDPTRIHHDIW
jgi:nitroreductase